MQPRQIMSAIDSLRSKGELEPPYPQKTSKAIKDWYALQTPEVKAKVEARVRELIERKKLQYGEFYEEPVDDPFTYAGQKIREMFPNMPETDRKRVLQRLRQRPLHALSGNKEDICERIDEVVQAYIRHHETNYEYILEEANEVRDLVLRERKKMQARGQVEDECDKVYFQWKGDAKHWYEEEDDDTAV